jgi:hypothetical protein
MKGLNILQKLEEIIKQDFKVAQIGGTLQLEESEAKGYPVTILKKNGAILAYNFDAKNSNVAVFPIFEPSFPNLTIIADYIIFYPYKDETLFVFVCNLKSDNTTSASEQAQGGWLLAEYIVKTVKRLLKYPENMPVEYRSLIFTTKLNVPTTRFSTNIKQDAYVPLGRSGLKSKTFKAGEDCYLDVLCF